MKLRIFQGYHLLFAYAASFEVARMKILVSSANRMISESFKILPRSLILGCALFYKPIWQLTVNERGGYADSEDTFLFKIEDSPDTRLGA